MHEKGKERARMRKKGRKDGDRRRDGGGDCTLR